MYHVITFGGATFDIFMKSKKFQVVKGKDIAISKVPMLCMIHGTKLVVEEAYFDIGGGGSNVAVGLANLGLKVASCVAVGKDIEGGRIKKLLKERKVATSFIVTLPKYKTALSCILYQAAERTILTYRGASDYLTKENINFPRLKKTKWFFISHLSGKSHGLLKDLMKFRKKNPHVKIAMNPGSTQLDLGLVKLSPFLKNCDVLILNKEEAEGLTNIKIKDLPGLKMKSFRPLFEKLSLYGPKIIAVTCGKKGAQAFSQGQIWSYPGFPVKIVANVGAGDAFCSGFLGAIILGKSVEEALCWGIVNGASCITKYGTQHGLLNRRSIINWAQKLNQKSKIKNQKHISKT